MFRNDSTVTLISVQPEIDDDGVSRMIEKEQTTVFCNVKNVSQSAFLAARQSGIKLAYGLIINKFEYAGQQEVLYEGKRYAVFSARSAGVEEIELIVEEVAGVG